MVSYPTEFHAIYKNCTIPADSDEWDNVRPMMSDVDVEAVRLLYCPSSKSVLRKKPVKSGKKKSSQLLNTTK